MYESDIPEDIQDAIKEVEDLLSQWTELSKRIDAQIDACSMLVAGDELVRSWGNIGDYEIRLEGGKISWNYRPKVLKGEGYDTSLYQDKISTSRIISFTMPPKDGDAPTR